MSNEIITAKQSNELLEYLLKRRSVPVKDIGEPGPDEKQIKTILKAASRVPDHGKMFPWYFIVFKGDAREKIGEIIERAWRAEEPEAAPAKIELERGRFLRAPVIIGVISRMRKGKHPLWEQILSAGAACQNLSLAANTLGFGTNWLTEWYSYSDVFREGIGLDMRDHVAGFMQIGTPTAPPQERDRPDLDEISTYWAPDVKLRKGDIYDRDNFDFPKAGFDLSNLG